MRPLLQDAAPRCRLLCGLLRPLPLEITGRLRVGTLPQGATGGPNLALSQTTENRKVETANPHHPTC